MRWTPVRHGFALIVAIAALAFVEVIALGITALAMRSRVTAEESAGQLAARVAAESAVRRGIALWDERGIGYPLPGSRFGVPWAAGTLPGGARFSLDAERLNRGLLLLRGTGWTALPPFGARATATAIVSSIPADPLWSDFHSGVVAGADFELLAGASIDAATPALPPAPFQATDCVNPGLASPVASGSPRPAIALAAGAALSLDPTATLLGSPTVLPNAQRSAPASFATLGRVPLTDLISIADRVETGAITLGPRSIGAACDTLAAGNWGAPGNRAHPCFPWLPLVYAPGDLAIDGGEGQGILVVAGNLSMAAGTRFFGAILVAGRLDADHAEIHGAVRTGSPSRSAAAIRFDECALTRAFTATRALRRVFRVSDRWWLPPW